MSPAILEKDKIRHPKQRKNGWTKQEEELLRQRYSSGTGDYVTEIADRLGRTRNAVFARAKKLKLYVHPVKIWTKAEEQFLKKNYRTMTRSEIGKRLGRSTSSVVRKLHAGLGLSTGSKHRWTAKEVLLVKRLYGKIRNAELAHRLGLTKNSIQACARKYGVAGHHYTRNEKQFIRNNYFTMSNARIAKHLDRSAVAVTVMAGKLGLSGTPEKRKYSRMVFRKKMKKRYWAIKEV